jgi:drug/metabolite transporter (DMT)-like permease
MTPVTIIHIQITKKYLYIYSAVLSSFFLKERLSFQGKIGCLQCILGAVMIVLHAPEQSSADTTIEAFKNLVLSVGK